MSEETELKRNDLIINVREELFHEYSNAKPSLNNNWILESISPLTRSMRIFGLYFDYHKARDVKSSSNADHFWVPHEDLSNLGNCDSLVERVTFGDHVYSWWHRWDVALLENHNLQLGCHGDIYSHFIVHRLQYWETPQILGRNLRDGRLRCLSTTVGSVLIRWAPGAL